MVYPADVADSRWFPLPLGRRSTRRTSTTMHLRFPSRPSQFCPRLSPSRIRSLMIPSMPGSGSKFSGESGRTYRLIDPLGSQGIQNTPTIWKAVDDADESEQFVVKEPSTDDDRSLGWPLFQHEHVMQKHFSDSVFIRQMVDFIPSATGTKPKMVLQAFEKTLWTARMQRPMASSEIKWIMKAVIVAIWTVHRKGFVYSGIVHFPPQALSYANLLQI